MSRIDDLIQRHCPDGVPFRALGEMLGYEQPTRYLVSSKAYVETGEVPVLTAGKTFILGYTEEEDGIYQASPESPVIIFDDFTTAFRWVDFPFKVKSSAMKMLTRLEGASVTLRYVWYAMQAIRYSPRNHARQWISTYSSLRIPAPPLEVQREIVRVLDLFQSLEAELEAELDARRQQYAHYRDSLLSFTESSLSRRARWMTLGQVSIAVSSGGTPLSTRSDFYGGDVPWLRTQEVRYIDITDTAVKITEAGLSGSAAKWIPPNCVIIAISGATAARSAVNKIPLTTNQHCCNLQIDPDLAHYRYVFHWVSREYLALKALGRGARSDLNARIIKDFPIPVPPLEEQKRIVRILDSFDALVNDLSVGLPAELAARRKQYEHYRDRLLTFEEAA